MLSESEAPAFLTAYEKADSSAAPQNDILTQSLKGKDEDDVAGRLLRKSANSAAPPQFSKEDTKVLAWQSRN